jgi:hypothetical protein
MTHPLRALLVGLGLVLAVAGCGSAPASPGSTVATAPVSAATTPPPTPSPTPTVGAAYPSCASVWVAGKKLSDHYAGCTTAGAAVLAHEMYCESGQHLVVFRNRFFAVRSGKIFASRDARRDPRYRQILTLCHG